MKKKNLLAILLSLAFLSSCSDKKSTSPEEGDPLSSSQEDISSSSIAISSSSSALEHPAEMASAQELAVRMGLGINLGNHFESPTWGSWSEALEDDTFTRIAALGFKHVRIPIRWDAYTSTTEPFTIEPDKLDSMVKVVHAAKQAGLLVVINQHHHEPIFSNPLDETPRFLAIWKQVAERFKGEGDYLLFELLNEPHNNLDQAAWDVLFPQIMATLRESNPRRTLVIGGVSWNSAAAMEDLVLPDDRTYIMATFHFYDPYQFTHQGASWAGPQSQDWIGTTWRGMEDEQNAIRTVLTQAAQWGDEQGVPVYMGEFGAFSVADTTSRALWTEFVTTTALSLDMPSAYWEWSSGFGIYDNDTQTLRNFLQKALLEPTIDWSSWPPRPDIDQISALLFDNFENTRGDSALVPALAAQWADSARGNPDSTSSFWYVYRVSTSNWSAPGVDTIYTNQQIEEGSPNNVSVLFSGEGHTGRGVDASLHLVGETYPWAGFGVALNPSDSTVDLRELQAISFWARGSGTIRMKIGTHAAEDTTLENNWGNFETSVTLSAEWRQHIIWADMLRPSPYSALESSSHTWSTAAQYSTLLEFMGPQLGEPSADMAIRLQVDDIYFHGVNPNIFGL